MLEGSWWRRRFSRGGLVSSRANRSQPIKRSSNSLKDAATFLAVAQNLWTDLQKSGAIISARRTPLLNRKFSQKTASQVFSGERLSLQVSHSL